MSALTSGTQAPAFALSTVDGGEFSLAEALSNGPAVLVFFKISCPVCQFALPYIERIYRAAKGKNVTIIGVSQNSKKDTAFFCKQYGLTFPMVLDDPRHYAVSNAYGITNVPTTFYVNQDGKIEVSSVSWSKAEVEEIARKVSDEIKSGPIPAFKPGEDVPAFRAG